MKCEKCGTELKDGDWACYICGEPVRLEGGLEKKREDEPEGGSEGELEGEREGSSEGGLEGEREDGSEGGPVQLVESAEASTQGWRKAVWRWLTTPRHVRRVPRADASPSEGERRMATVRAGAGALKKYGGKAAGQGKRAFKRGKAIWGRIDERGTQFLEGARPSGAQAVASDVSDVGEFHPKDVEEHRTMAVYSYLPLVAIPIVKAHGSRYVRFHVNQGLALLFCEILYLLFCVVASLALSRWFRYAPLVIGVLALLFMVFLVLAVIGMWNAATGRAKALPLVGRMKVWDERGLLAFARFFPDECVESAYLIDYEELYGEGVRGLVFDIDNTLVEHGADASEEARALFGRLREMGFETCLISNNGRERVERFNQEIQTLYLFKAGKPGRSAYLQAMNKMGTDLENTVFIGDQLFTDIYGAKRSGMRNILVEPVGKKEEVQIVVKRRLERIVMYRYGRGKNKVG